MPNTRPHMTSRGRRPSTWWRRCWEGSGGAAFRKGGTNGARPSICPFDRHQAVWGLNKTPLCSQLAQQRDILGDHFFRALKRDARLGIVYRHLAVGFHAIHEFLTRDGWNRSLSAAKGTRAG